MEHTTGPTAPKLRRTEPLQRETPKRGDAVEAEEAQPDKARESGTSRTARREQAEAALKKAREGCC